jgi:hypothetical protein
LENDWAEPWARLFHETYERLAPQFDYETRKESAKPWIDVPENNKRLMVAVVEHVLQLVTCQPAVPFIAATQPSAEPLSASEFYAQQYTVGREDPPDMFKFSETYAAHRCAALEAERDDWKRKAEELTPEDMRGMAYDTNALLKAKIEAL